MRSILAMYSVGYLGSMCRSSRPPGHELRRGAPSRRETPYSLQRCRCCRDSPVHDRRVQPTARLISKAAAVDRTTFGITSAVKMIAWLARSPPWPHRARYWRKVEHLPTCALSGPPTGAVCCDERFFPPGCAPNEPPDDELARERAQAGDIRRYRLQARPSGSSRACARACARCTPGAWWRKPSAVSPGSPAIRSMFTAKPPVSRIRDAARRKYPARCGGGRSRRARGRRASGG